MPPVERNEIFPGTHVWYINTDCDYPRPAKAVVIKNHGHRVILDDGKIHNMESLYFSVDEVFCRHWEYAIEDKMNNLSELLKYVRQKWR